MNEVTRILSAIEQGDPHAAEQLLPLVYDELRKLAAAKLAQEQPGALLCGRRGSDASHPRRSSAAQTESAPWRRSATAGPQ